MGCPHWDQDINIVAKSPIEGVENVMYTLHFYAATHKDYRWSHQDMGQDGEAGTEEI